MAPPSALQTWHAATAVSAVSIASLNLSLSFIVTPSLLPLPTYWMLRQWTDYYRRTRTFFSLAMVACGISYAALALRLSSSAVTATRARLLGAAAALCLSIIPWTRLLMLKRLEAKIFEMSKRHTSPPDQEVWPAQEEQTAKWLVDQWGMYNLGRGVPVLIAGAVGVLTLF